MATPNDDKVAAMLAEMRDSQPPAISPIKSPSKRASSDSEEEIPASQPPPKRPRTIEGFSSLQNKIAYLETRRAKTKKSLCVLKEHVSKSSCPVGLQYRPRPHLRSDQNFSTDLQKICERAEQDLLQLMIQQQEKNVNEDTEAINALKQKLTTMIPDQTKREHAEKRVLSATSRSNFRASKHRRANKQQNKADEINDLKAKISVLTTLVNTFPNVKIIKKELHCTQVCGSLTLLAPNPCEPRPLVKSDLLSAKPLEISTKRNLGLLMRNSLKICPIQTLLTKKLLCLQKASNLFQLRKNRLHKKISLEILILLLALCV